MGKSSLIKNTTKPAHDGITTPTGDCAVCGFYKSILDPTPGHKIEGLMGKCTRSKGLCEAKVRSLYPQTFAKFDAADAADDAQVQNDLLNMSPPTLVPGTQPVSVREKKRLAELETFIIDNFKTFYDVGCALREINAGLLYRETHGTFEDYCRDLFDIARQTAYQYIDAANVVDNVRNCGQIENDSPDTQIPLPQNEAQARELAKVPPEKQAEIWAEIVQSAPDGRITAKHAKSVIRDAKVAKVKAATEKAKKRETYSKSRQDEDFQAAFKAFCEVVEKARMDDWRNTDKQTVLNCLIGIQKAIETPF